MTAAPVHTLIQITDLHLLPDGALLFDRLDTFDSLTRTLAVIEESGLRPTALVFTGDLADRGDAESYRRLRGLVEPVAARIGAVPLYVMGNHDDRAALREHLLELPPDPAPYHHVTRIGGLRVIVLDSSVPGHAHGELGPRQLEWLAAELAEPAPDGTVLALHHPPLPTSSRLLSAIGLRDRVALGAVLAGSDVRIVLAGHTHVVSGGTLAGIPVWTGGAMAYVMDSLAADRFSSLVAPALNRIDLFADSVLATAVPVGAETGPGLTAAQIDAIVAAATATG